MNLYFFGKFHVRQGCEAAAMKVIREVVPPSHEEAGCIRIHAFRAKRDGQLFIIHSQWVDEAAFDLHSELPHTIAFLRAMEPLLDQPMETIRTEMLA